MDKGNSKLRKQIDHSSVIKLLISSLLLVTAILASSCSSPTAEELELERNEKLWQSQNLTNYDFTLERQCFCSEDWRGPVNIQVRNGTVVSVTYVSNGQAALAEKFSNSDTIEKLFGIIGDAYEGKNTFNQKAETVNVTFHPEMGYPLTIFIDVSKMIADEETGYTIEELVRR
jgi:Family of unknown function (DUF6174)